MTVMANTDPFIVPPGIYLAAHSIGPMTTRGRDLLASDFITPWEEAGYAAWDSWLPLIDRFCEGLSGILGGQADEFCPQPNLSAGFYQYVTSLPQTSARRTIVMHETAFPSMGFVIKALTGRGFTLKLIPKDRPAGDVSVWAEYVGRDDFVRAHHPCALEHGCALTRQRNRTSLRVFGGEVCPRYRAVRRDYPDGHG